MNTATVAALVLGAGAGAGLLGLVGALTRRPGPVAAGPRPEFSRRVAHWWGRAAARRATAGVAAGVGVALLTRWPVAAAAAVALVYFWPALFGARRAATTAIERLEGLATWTESLRDTIAGAISLEQAIPATIDAAPAVLEQPLRRLAGLLRARTPLPEALARFGEDLDDPSADLVVASLILNSRLRGKGLAATLTALAISAREELDMRRRIEADRKSLRRAAHIVVGVTLVFAAGLVLFSRDYVAPYGTGLGQVMLVVVIGLFAIGFAWLRQLAVAQVPDRFLVPAEQLSRTGGPR